VELEAAGSRAGRPRRNRRVDLDAAVWVALDAAGGWTSRLPAGGARARRWVKHEDAGSGQGGAGSEHEDAGSGGLGEPPPGGGWEGGGGGGGGGLGFLG
jgi:hypothetical protein